MRRNAATPLPRLALLAALLALAAAQSPSRYHSARCLGDGSACSRFVASRSRVCGAGLRAAQQSADCVAAACRWCRRAGKAELPPCTKRVVRSRCGLGALTTEPDEVPVIQPEPVEAPEPEPAVAPEEEGPLPSPSVSPAAPVDRGGRNTPVSAGACTWEGDDAVVISLGEVEPAEGWTPVTRDGFSGLVYRSDLTRGLSRKSPPQGEMCFPVRVRESGEYFFKFVSYAPEKTENNDAWIKTSKPLRLQRTVGNDSMPADADEYRKAYIANGAELGMASVMFTVDNEAHRFIVQDVVADEPFQVCIAGRSFKFEVFRLVLKKCFFRICTTGKLWKSFIYDMPVSTCV